MIKRPSFFILLNLIIIIDTLVILFSNLIKDSSSFHYFTVLSNLFMAVIAIIAIYSSIKQSFPRLVNTLYLIATTSLVLVFLVVLLFLFPQYKNPSFLFMGHNFFLHLLNPLLATISLFLLKNAAFNYKTCCFTLLPPFLYAVVYYTFVVLRKEWPDFYNFTSGGKEWVSFISLFIILCVTYTISAILVFYYRKISKQEPQKRSSIKG